jgi:CRP-like cAMP-binding protein
LHPEHLRLRAIPLFADLGPDDLDRVASWLEIREESEGRRLTPEGASGYEFFVIEDGTAEVHHEGAKVGSLGPGDFFGEMAMIGRTPGRRRRRHLTDHAVRDVRDPLPGVGDDPARGRRAYPRHARGAARGALIVVS